MPLDPAAAAATTATRPISPLPHHYPPPQQQQQQTLPIRAQNPHFLYPFAPKGVRAADHAVSPAFPPGPPHIVDGGGGGVRGMPLDCLPHALHVTRPPPHAPFGPVGNAAAAAPTASPTVKKATPRSAVSDINGGKDTGAREKNREDTYIVVRDRKVKITEDASLYALCRSWLRNGVNEESQPQQKDVIKALPKPLPASMVASYLSNKKEDEKDEEQEENEQSVENLSPQDLLKRHIKRAKKVRARLREERLQRITRYRSRLRLLLPPAVEQCRNDTAAEN